MVLYLKEQFYNYVKSYRDFAEKIPLNTFFKYYIMPKRLAIQFFCPQIDFKKEYIEESKSQRTSKSLIASKVTTILLQHQIFFWYA